MGFAWSVLLRQNVICVALQLPADLGSKLLHNVILLYLMWFSVALQLPDCPSIGSYTCGTQFGQCTCPGTKGCDSRDGACKVVQQWQICCFAWWCNTKSGWRLMHAIHHMTRVLNLLNSVLQTKCAINAPCLTTCACPSPNRCDDAKINGVWKSNICLVSAERFICCAQARDKLLPM